MARLMTKEERIQHMLQENAKKPCTSMERTYDYCKAFVEGEMAIEAAMKNVKLMHVNFTREEAIKKCHGINHPECLVQALEAMGLIKFRTEPVSPEDKFITLVNELPPSENGRAILRHLKQNGLTVVETKV